jgi:hypothetical protein
MAAANQDVLTIGVVASGAIAQYNAVTAAGAVATAAGNAVGFAKTAGASGARVPVQAAGVAIAIAGAAIALGAAVEVGSTGQVVTKSAGVTVGRALSVATGAGDQVEVLIIPN